MTILCYNPAPSQQRFRPFEALKGSPFFRRPHYDAMRLAYLFKKEKFYYYDERIEEKPQINPDVVIVYTPLNLARYIENNIRKKWSDGIEVITYGPYPTLFPDRAIKFSDAVVIGDITGAWQKIANDLSKGRLSKNYQSKNPISFAVDRSLELKYGFTPLLSQLKTAYGCQCHKTQKDYCFENIIYPDVIRPDLNEAFREITRIKRKVVVILDDDFLGDPDFGIKLLERCWKYKKMWIIQTTGRLFKTPRYLTHLRDNGVRIIYLKEDWLGTSLHKKIQNKNFVKKKAREINLIHNYRITAGCKLRLGYEGENYDFYQALFKFLMRIRVDLIEILVQTPIPGTPTFQALSEADRIVQDFTLYDQWMPVVKIPGVTPQVLYSWMEWLRDKFYSWDSIILRNILVSPRLGFYNTMFFYFLPNFSYRNNFLEKVGYPP